MKSNLNRSLNLEKMFWVSFVLYLLFIPIRFFDVISVKYDFVSQLLIDGNFYIVLAIIGFVNIIIQIVLIIMFIQWFRRAYYNLHNLPHENLRLEYSEEWASGGWFVPILNIQYPFAIMRDLWYNYHRLNGVKDKEENLVNVWWVLLVFYFFLSKSTFFFSYLFGSDILELLTIVSICSNLILLVCYFLIIKIVKELRPLESKVYKTDDLQNLEDQLIET